MSDEKKYPFQYGKDKLFTREEAIQDMREYMEFLKKNKMENREPVWYLYLQNDHWCAIAGTVVDELGTGERIQEFNVLTIT